MIVDLAAQTSAPLVPSGGRLRSGGRTAWGPNLGQGANFSILRSSLALQKAQAAGLLERQRVKIWLKNGYEVFDRLACLKPLADSDAADLA